MSDATQLGGLLPCPFCGGTDIERANNGPTYGAFWTMCNGCGTCTGEFGISTQEQADAAWNTRAAPTPPEVTDAMVEAACWAFEEVVADGFADRRTAKARSVAIRAAIVAALGAR